MLNFLGCKRKTEDKSNGPSNKKQKSEIQILQKLESLSSKDYSRICRITSTVLKGSFYEMNGGE